MNKRNHSRTESDLEETVVQVKRVSKKTKGGNTIGFSVLTVVGDKKGKVGLGIGKGPDVASSIRKGFTAARKDQVTVPLKGTTIPHKITHKFGAAKVMLKPALPGTGLIAGGSVRPVLFAAGIQDIIAKVLGTRNAITNVYCVFEALRNLKSAPGPKKEPQKKNKQQKAEASKSPKKADSKK